jgi:hypothetical protein
MSLIEQLGTALGLATLAGVNLYLVVFVAGLAMRFGWVELGAEHASLALLGNPWILGVSGLLFLVEFCADKIPWVDSAWDSVHTLVRPVGGAMLALAALGPLDPVVATVAALLAGGASLSTHSVKAGVRAILNLSPEPVSNSVASVTEDGLVLGGLGLIAFSPFLALFVFVLVVTASVAACMWLWQRLRRKSCEAAI